MTDRTHCGSAARVEIFGSDDLAVAAAAVVVVANLPLSMALCSDHTLDRFMPGLEA